MCVNEKVTMVFPLIVVAFAGIGVTRLALLALELTDPEQLNKDEKNILPKSSITKLMVEKEKPKKLLLLENGTQYIRVWDDEDLRASNPWHAVAARVIQHAKELKERSELVMYLRETFGLNNAVTSTSKSISNSKASSPLAAISSSSSDTNTSAIEVEMEEETETDLLIDQRRRSSNNNELIRERTITTTTTVKTTTTTTTTITTAASTLSNETEIAAAAVGSTTADADLYLEPEEQGEKTCLRCITKENIIENEELKDEDGRKQQQDLIESSPTSTSSTTLGSPTRLTEEELEEIRLRKEAKILMQQQMIAENMKIIEQNGDQNMCVICYDAKIDAVLIGCGHSSLCFSCSVDCYRNTKECPLCRAEIEQILQVDMEARKILPVRKKKDDSNPLDPLGLFRGSNDTSSKTSTTIENLPDEMVVVPVIGPTAELVEKYELLEKVQNELAEIPDVNPSDIYVETEEEEIEARQVIEQGQDNIMYSAEENASSQDRSQHVNNTVNNSQNNGNETLSSTTATTAETTPIVATPLQDIANMFGSISSSSNNNNNNNNLSSNISDIFQQFQTSSFNGPNLKEAKDASEESESRTNATPKAASLSSIDPVPTAAAATTATTIDLNGSSTANSFASFFQLADFFSSKTENQSTVSGQHQHRSDDTQDEKEEKKKKNTKGDKNDNDDDDDGESKIELFDAPSLSSATPAPASIVLQPAAGSIF